MTNASTETKPKAAHTPGPWLIRETDSGIYDTDDDRANVVARGPYGLITIAEEVDVADARLIAAAPDLLAAVFAALGGAPGWDDLARAAIAKAEGRA